MFRRFRWFKVLFLLTLLLGFAPATGSTPRAPAVQAAPEASELAVREAPFAPHPLAPAAIAATTAYTGTATGDARLDLSFDPGSGKIGYVYALALQPDGKILIGGTYFTTRLNPDGSQDTTFDPGRGPDDSVRAITLQPDGKFIIGGEFTSYNRTMRTRIARVNPDGSSDITFDPGRGPNDAVYALALQPDGKILIGGRFITYDGTGSSYIARLNDDGSVDTTFTSGIPNSGLGAKVYAIALQPDGKILVGGEFAMYDYTVRNIARLNSDGSLDTTFDPGTGADSHVWALALQPNGKILIGGGFTSYNGYSCNAIARLDTNGSLDTSFNSGLGGSSPRAFALQSDGKILVSNASTNGIDRLNRNGSLDTTFDPGSGANHNVYALALQPDGKILIGGQFMSYDGYPRNRIARLYNPPANLSQNVFPALAAPGELVTYTLRLDNNLTTTLTSIVLTDTLPTDVLNPQVSSNITLTPRGGTRYVWDVADLARGASAAITIAAQLADSPERTQLTNLAHFSSSNGGAGQASTSVTIPGIEVALTGSGYGQVTSAPAGIACDPDCSQAYPIGTVVTLTATPEPPALFKNWQGDVPATCQDTNPCILTVGAIHQIVANFSYPVTYPDVTISAVRNGHWNNPRTWSAKRVPNPSDTVEISDRYTVNAPAEKITVRKLYQHGILQSARNAALELQVTETLSNTGAIRGQTGASTVGAACGAPGGDVILSGDILENSGTIQGGDGRGSRCCGGDGGMVSLTFGNTRNRYDPYDTLINTGRIIGGTGGDTTACCTTNTVGNGGDVTLLGTGHGYKGLHSTGDIQGGTGGDQQACGNGGCGGNIVMSANPVGIYYSDRNKLAHVLGGTPGRNSDGTIGDCEGDKPDIYIDPNSITINNTQLASDDIVIFGGANWTMALTDTATGMISATQGITLAVGAGGSIDLRGSEAGAFTTSGNFFVASDNVILDAGQTLSDVVSATQIVTTPAQILGDIAISAPGFIQGLRQQELNVPIELVNNSPVTFTYQLQGTGAYIDNLPVSITIGPVSSVVITPTVQTPLMGGEETATVTATATVSPFHSASAAVRVYAPPRQLVTTLSQTFTAGVFTPFTDDVNCGGVTFAEDWTGELTITMREEVTSTDPVLLPRSYTASTSSAAPQADLTLCYDARNVEDAGIPTYTPLALHDGDWLPTTPISDDTQLTATVTLSGAWRIGAPRYTLTLTGTGEMTGTLVSDPEGVTCDTGSGQSCTADYWAGAAMRLVAYPAQDAVFQGWSGSIESTQNPITFTLNSDSAITATFTRRPVKNMLTLRTTGTGAGVISPTVGTHTYTSGTVVTLEATPAPTSTFGGWSGARNEMQNPITLTMDTDKTITATFHLASEAVTHTLTTAVTGTGTGTITPTVGTHSYVSGTVVTLEATPDPGATMMLASTFAGWSGDPDCEDGSVTMDANKTCTATFNLISEAISHTLTITTAGTGSGIVTPTVGAHTYVSGTSVTLQATANISSTFTGWSGDAGCDVGAVIMDADKACTATFTFDYHVVYLPLILRQTQK